MAITLPRLTRRSHSVPEQPVRRVARPEYDPEEAELRRQLYERIAQGNALAEAEDNAERHWRGQ